MSESNVGLYRAGFEAAKANLCPSHVSVNKDDALEVIEKHLNTAKDTLIWADKRIAELEASLTKVTAQKAELLEALREALEYVDYEFYFGDIAECRDILKKYEVKND